MARMKRTYRPGEVPARLRWRPRVSIIGVILGALGGLGVVVYLQQSGWRVLDRALSLQGVIGGALSGILIPSLIYAITVRRYNRRLSAFTPRPRVATALVWALAIPLAAGLVAATPAHATVEGPCTVTINGTDIGGLEPTADDAIVVTEDDTLVGQVSHPSEWQAGSIDLHYAAFSVTIVDEFDEVVNDEDQVDTGASISQGSADVADLATYGTGVYAFFGAAVMESGAECSASFAIKLDKPPLETPVGIAAAAAAAIGAVAAAGVAIGGIREGSSLVGGLDEHLAGLEPPPDTFTDDQIESAVTDFLEGAPDLGESADSGVSAESADASTDTGGTDETATPDDDVTTDTSSEDAGETTGTEPSAEASEETTTAGDTGADGSSQPAEGTSESTTAQPGTDAAAETTTPGDTGADGSTQPTESTSEPTTAQPGTDAAAETTTPGDTGTDGSTQPTEGTGGSTTTQPAAETASGGTGAPSAAEAAAAAVPAGGWASSEDGSDFLGTDSADSVSSGIESVTDAATRLDELAGDLGVSDEVRDEVKDRLQPVGDRLGSIKDKVDLYRDTVNRAGEISDDVTSRLGRLGVNERGQDAITWMRWMSEGVGNYVEGIKNEYMRPFTDKLASAFGGEADDYASALVPIGDFGREMGNFVTTAAENVKGGDNYAGQLGDLANLPPDDPFAGIDEVYRFP